MLGGTTYYSEPVKYSPMKYIKTVLEGNYAREDKDLVSALRAYGNAAQVKFNYHTERLAGETYYDLTLTNAHLDDGFTYGLYKEGKELTATADVPDGKELVEWTDGAGQSLGADPTLRLTLQADTALTAVFGARADYSAYTGKQFTAQTTALLPYFFTGGPLTIEAVVRVPSSVTGRGGVIVGNYDYGDKQTLNLEIYTEGRVRLYFERGDSTYSIVFDTDIRSDALRRIAVTIGEKNGACALYIDARSLLLPGRER